MTDVKGKANENVALDELSRAFDERRRKDEASIGCILGQDESDVDPLSLPPEAWGSTAWEFMDPTRRDKMLAGMFRRTLARAMQVMPIYQTSAGYNNVKPSAFDSMGDLAELPLLVKDGDHGFREAVRTDPSLLRPTDIKVSMTPYLSGGTGIDETTAGKPTPTWISMDDLDLESRALASRCFVPGGFHACMRVMNFYNLAHKGGQEIMMALHHLGVVTVMPRRPEDSLEQCVDYMTRFNINGVMAVPKSPKDRNGAPKGGSVSFESLYLANAGLFGADALVKNAFVTGFQIPGYVEQLAEQKGIRMFTTWGASEAIPGATSTVLGPQERVCKFNSMHLTYFPHYLSVMNLAQGRACRPGEEGLLLVTTIARQGTIWINYVIGDKATVISDACPCGRTTPVIGDIRRVDNPSELALGGCRFA